MIRTREAANYRRPAPRVRTARWLLVGLLVLTFSWLGLVSRLRVVGMGHVRAEEIVLSPVYEGRIDALNVTCLDRVAAGDLLAVVGNPIRAHGYREELAAEDADARTRAAAHAARITTAVARLDAAERTLSAARRHDANAAELAAATEQAWQANAVPLKERVAVLNARARAGGELATAEAGLARRRAELERVQVDAAMQMAGFAERVDAQRIRAGLGESLEIRAPFDAVVTDCPRDVGDIVRPSVAVLRIQRVGSAHVFVWVPATDAGRIVAGLPVDVVLSDSGRSLTGRVAGPPTDVGSLPRSLKRYFWQNQAWQQYARVAVTLDDRFAADLRGDARVDAVIHTGSLLSLPLTLLEAL